MPKPTRLYNLDFLRGTAAFLVLIGHLRAYVFQNYNDIAHENLHIKAFYFITGLGHQAVIIFFALSGFLVGGKALSDILNHRFSWSRYFLRRLTRLWIVIFPALLLTLFLDGIGSWLTGGMGYGGQYYEIYNSGPHGPAGIDHSLLTFFGNLAFLQTIYVPTFGSNGPMWSLANEFWYYVVFPLAAWVVLVRSATLVRVAALCILFLIVMLLPTWLLAGGLIWVAGAVAAWCTKRPTLARVFKHLAARVGVISALLAALILTKIRPDDIGDLGLGIVVALSLPILATLPSPGSLYNAVSHGASEFSYTLYLTHFPLLTLISLAGFAPSKFSPSIFSAGLYVTLLTVALAWAAAAWWCFERNTDRAYFAITNAFPTPTSLGRESAND